MQHTPSRSVRTAFYSLIVKNPIAMIAYVSIFCAHPFSWFADACIHYRPTTHTPSLSGVARSVIRLAYRLVKFASAVYPQAVLYGLSPQRCNRPPHPDPSHMRSLVVRRAWVLSVRCIAPFSQRRYRYRRHQQRRTPTYLHSDFLDLVHDDDLFSSLRHLGVLVLERDRERRGGRGGFARNGEKWRAIGDGGDAWRGADQE